MRKAPAAVLILSSVWCPSTATAQGDRSEILIGQWEPPPGQRCEPLSGRLPSFGAMFDSMPVAEALSAGGETGTIVLSAAMYLARDRSMRNDTTWLVESTVSDTTAARVQALLRSHVRQGVDDMVLLRIDLGSQFMARTSYTLQCAPVLRDEAALRTALTDLARGAARRSGMIQLTVNRDGTVRDVMLETGTGDRSLDNRLVGLVRGLRYYPALVNRRPIPLRLRVPVNLN
jgi:TonB family protein